MNLSKLKIAGDFAYADTWLTETTQGYLNASATEGAEAYESILNIFYDQLTNITKKVPFMTAPGNHEANCVDDVYDCPIGQSNFTGYINHFRMPSDVASQAVDNPGVGNMWYSYDNGLYYHCPWTVFTNLCHRHGSLCLSGYGDRLS